MWNEWWHESAVNHMIFVSCNDLRISDIPSSLGWITIIRLFIVCSLICSSKGRIRCWLDPDSGTRLDHILNELATYILCSKLARGGVELRSATLSGYSLCLAEIYGVEAESFLLVDGAKTPSNQPHPISDDISQLLDTCRQACWIVKQIRRLMPLYFL